MFLSSTTVLLFSLMVSLSIAFPSQELLTCNEPKLYQLDSSPSSLQICGLQGKTTATSENQTISDSEDHCQEIFLNTTWPTVSIKNLGTEIQVATSPTLPLLQILTDKNINFTVVMDGDDLEIEIFVVTCLTERSEKGFVNCSVPTACYGESFTCKCLDTEITGYCTASGVTSLEEVEPCPGSIEAAGTVPSIIVVLADITIGEKFMIKEGWEVLDQDNESNDIQINYEEGYMLFEVGNYVVEIMRENYLYEYHIDSDYCPNLGNNERSVLNTTIKYGELELKCGKEQRWNYNTPENITTPFREIEDNEGNENITTTISPPDFTTSVSNFTSENSTFSNSTIIGEETLSENAIIGISAAGGVTFLGIVGAGFRAWRRRRQG